MSERKKVLIVEPSCIIAEGLERILASSPCLEPLHPQYDIDVLPNRLAGAKPDIIVINPTLIADTTRYALKDILREYPSTAVVALVYQYVEQSTLRTYHGCLDIREQKERIAELLMESLQSLSVNELSDDTGYELSKRETDVLICVAKGLMNKEIADRLNISVHTVISHRKNITRKTNIHSTAGLAVYAMMNNLIEDAGI
jgi:DNA-binding NarL/FixJ family response regulator